MADRVGQQLGNYRLLQLLGYGGFAEVYLGEHIYLETEAAIKVLRTQLASEDIEQFRVEARTIAHLVHPHIVRVLEFGVEGSTPFLIMDYAPHGSLRHRHPKGSQVPIPLVVSYVKQAALALQYAHEQKLIHRDIKPENMLVASSDEILLSDFGIATIAHSLSSLKTESYSGTPYYSAPEQIAGKPRPASDQYSLGIVVYEWLTGAQPFTGDITQLIYQHMYVPPPHILEKLPALAPDVEEVVLQTLAKDPNERFASVQAFAAALEQASQETLSSPIQVTTEFSRYGTGVQKEPGQQPFPKNTVSFASRQETPIDAGPQFPPTEPMPTQTIPTPAKPARAYIYAAIGLALLVILGSSFAFFYFKGIGLHSTPPGASSGVSGRQTSTSTAAATATTQTAVTPTPRAIATLNAASSNPYPPHTGTLAVNDSMKSSAAGGWDTSATCRFTGGSYHVSVGAKTNSCLYASGTFANLAYQAQMVFVTANTCGGFIFSESDTFFLSYDDFYICTDGSYHLDSFSAFGTPLRNGTSDAIQTTTGQANIIAVVANGKSFDVYINNVHIATVSVNGVYSGQIGFLAGNPSGSSGSAEVAFNNVKVWTL